MDFFRHMLSRIDARGLNAGRGIRNGFAFPNVADESIARISGGRQAIALLAFAFLLSSPSTHAAGSEPSLLHCSAGCCGLLGDDVYSNQVIGRLVDTDMTRIYQWAMVHVYWRNLPVSVQPYLRDVKRVTIAVPKDVASRPIKLFMLQLEYASAPYRVGDQVRYPHADVHDKNA